MGVSEGGGKLESNQKWMLVEQGVLSRYKQGLHFDCQQINFILVVVSVTFGRRGRGGLHHFSHPEGQYHLPSKYGY